MKLPAAKYLKLIFKILLTTVLVWFLYNKIDLSKSFQLFKTINLIYLVPGILCLGLSKFFSAERLLEYVTKIPIPITRKLNIQLYLLGMFYNLFLPGGIGGDGYKVYFFRKKYPDVPLKRILLSLLLDRLSGFFVLLLIMIAFVSIFPLNIPYKIYAQVMGIFTLLILFYILHKLLFSSSGLLMTKSLLLSMGVQISQLICISCILASFPETHFFIELLFVFLISTITAMIPITIGGSGLREITFLYFASIFHYDETISVSSALLFFLISAGYSLIGLYYVWKPKLLTK